MKFDIFVCGTSPKEIQENIKKVEMEWADHKISILSNNADYVCAHQSDLVTLKEHMESARGCEVLWMCGSWWNSLECVNILLAWKAKRSKPVWSLPAGSDYLDEDSLKSGMCFWELGSTSDYRRAINRLFTGK